MPQVSAWKCPRSNKLFLTKKKYLAYLKKTARKELDERIYRKKINGIKSQFAEMRETCSTATEIEEWIKAHADLFWYWAYEREVGRFGCDYIKKPKTPPVFSSISIRGTFQERCSNTHSCPLNGVTNWECEDDKPSGYPGFYGRITFCIEPDSPGFGGDIFKGTGINTGSGGGRNKSLSYDVTLFLDDWPALANRVTKERNAKLAREIKESRKIDFACTL